MKPVREGHLASEGHRPYWAEYGPRDGAPLLLVHGGGGYTIDPEKMDGLDLTKQRVIALHQRGVGRSLPEGETRHNTVPANIEDMERLRAALGIERWDMLAWSFGATLAAGYALSYPERVGKLICYAPYLGSDEDYQVIRRTAPELAKKYMAFHEAETGRGIVTSVFNKAAAPDEAQRLNAYAAAMKLFDESLTPDSIRASMTDAEWKKLSRARLIGATLDKSLFHEHDRFLERAVAKRGRALAATLIYGGKDCWSAPNAYARTVFNAAATHMVPDAGHDIHSPQVQKILKRALLPV
jgi:proline iminopeptidase